MKEQIKEAVNQWLKNNKDFDKGVDLLSALKPQMARIFRGREKTYAKKLEYELKKLAGITELPKKVIPSKGIAQIEKEVKQNMQPPKKTETVPAVHTPDPLPETPGKKEPKQTAKPRRNETPPFISQIIKEHARLFKLRSQLDAQRAEVPEKNHPTYNKKRKILSESIQQLSASIEALFMAKEDYYEKGIMPDMKALFPDLPARDVPPAPKKAAGRPKKEKK